MQLNGERRNVGTTIFTVMSKLAQECGAINLSQGLIFGACGLHPRRSKV
jgi:hypothetical protein